MYRNQEVWVKKSWSVEMTKEAEKALRLDFRSGKITSDDIVRVVRVTVDHDYKK